MTDDRWLTAAQATKQLGVKPQTFYAYVSRGLVRRERAADRRTSRYARDDVERLAAHGRPRARTDGFEVVIDQAVTLLDPVGRLSYRGWDATPRRGRRPLRRGRSVALGRDHRTSRPLDCGPHGLATRPARAGGAADDTPLPDRLRIIVAALRPGDPLRNDRRVASVAARAGTLLATMVEALPPVDARDEPSATGSLARRLWTRVSPLDATTARVRALDRALSLLADHELATSTLAVRVAASTWADPYLLLLTGLAAVGGPLHGGASEFVRSLLRDAMASTPEAAVGQALHDGEHVPGFGHQVYRGPDPRTPVLLDAVARLKPPAGLWPRRRECST